MKAAHAKSNRKTNANTHTCAITETDVWWHTEQTHLTREMSDEDGTKVGTTRSEKSQRNGDVEERRSG